MRAYQSISIITKTLTFLFEAKLADSGDYEPIRAGYTIQVVGLNDIFEDYGILVDVKKDRRDYQLPLVDLRVKDNQASQYQMVEDYATWFANR